MKKLIILALAGLSAQAAFSQVCEVDMINRYNRVVRTFTAYGDPNHCVEAMKECRKTIRFSPQLGGVDCIRAGGSQPVPPSNPYPPTNPVPTYGVSVSGIIEDNPFVMTGRDASELYINCLTDIRSVIFGSSDELFFSANNNRFVSTSTGGWYNDTQICSILEQEARRSYSTPYVAPMRIVGSLERSPFQIDAYNRGELLMNCIHAFEATGERSTDQLSYSLNGAPFRSISTSGWWNSPARACKAMIQHLDNQL